MGRNGASGILLLLAACAGDPSVVEDVPEPYRRTRLVVPAIQDAHPYGFEGLKPGAWVTVREPRRTVTVAVVGREDDALWFEEIDEGEPRLVSARLVGPDGRVRKAWYAEIPKDSRLVGPEAQAILQTPPANPSSLRETSREEREAKVRVGTRELACRAVTVRLEDLEGRFVEEEQVWCAEVPAVYGGAPGRGLVRRRTREGVTELEAFGADAVALLPRPK